MHLHKHIHVTFTISAFHIQNKIQPNRINPQIHKIYVNFYASFDRQENTNYSIKIR